MQDADFARFATWTERTLGAPKGEAALLSAIHANDGSRDARLAAYLYRRSVREEALWRGALGAGEAAVFQKLS